MLRGTCTSTLVSPQTEHSTPQTEHTSLRVGKQWRIQRGFHGFHGAPLLREYRIAKSFATKTFTGFADQVPPTKVLTLENLMLMCGSVV